MSREYVISEDRDYKEGNGIKAYIKDGKFICDVVDECGNAGGEWFCDIELLRYHIERYKQGLKGEKTMETVNIDYKEKCEELEAKVEKLENMVENLIKALNNQPKPVVFVAKDEDKIKKIKKFLNENTLDI